MRRTGVEGRVKSLAASDALMVANMSGEVMRRKLRWAGCRARGEELWLVGIVDAMCCRAFVEGGYGFSDLN